MQLNIKTVLENDTRCWSHLRLGCVQISDDFFATQNIQIEPGCLQKKCRLIQLFPHMPACLLVLAWRFRKEDYPYPTNSTIWKTLIIYSITTSAMSSMCFSTPSYSYANLDLFIVFPTPASLHKTSLEVEVQTWLSYLYQTYPNPSHQLYTRATVIYRDSAHRLKNLDHPFNNNLCHV